MTGSKVSRLGTAPEEGTKAPVIVSTTGPIDHIGEQLINGVNVVAGDRVLDKDNTDLTLNGIWVCSVGAWERATDFNDAQDIIAGQLVPDNAGGVFANSSIYMVHIDGEFTEGVSEITFTEAISRSGYGNPDVTALNLLNGVRGAVGYATADEIRALTNITVINSKVELSGTDQWGVFYADLTDTSTLEDGINGSAGSVIVTGEGVRLKRPKEDKTHARWWGNANDGCIQAAINKSVNGVVSLTSKFPYSTSTEINCIPSAGEGVKLEGNGASITATASMQSILKLGPTTSIRTSIKDVDLRCNDQATHGVHATLVTEYNSVFENIYVIDALSHGMYLDGCQVMTVRDVTVVNCGATGIIFESCNGLSASGIRSTANNGNGITVQRGSRNFTGGLQLQDINCETNTNYGLSIVDTKSPVTVTGGWLESNLGHGVNIGAAVRGASIKGMGIIGAGNGGSRSVRLENGSAGCTVIDNQLQATDTSAEYIKVLDENTSIEVRNRTYPNYIRSTGGLQESNTVSGYNNSDISSKLTTISAHGKGGYLAGSSGTDVISAGGSSVFTWTPSGTFNIPGPDDRGAYVIELDLIGYLVGVDQSIALKVRIFASTRDSSVYDGSSTIVYALGDSRVSGITVSAPVTAGPSVFSVTISNSDASNFTATHAWVVMTTTKGQLSLAVT